MDCQTCFTKSTTASYCLINSTSEYCCDESDKSDKCVTSVENKVQCSPKRKHAGNFFYTYCRNAGNPHTCGVNNLELRGSGSTRKISVDNLPYKVTLNHQISYLSCYYQIKADEYTWKDGAKIEVTVTKQSNVRFYMYGGTSRTNASINVTFNNGSLTEGTTYSIDVSAGAMLLVLPLTNKV